MNNTMELAAHQNLFERVINTFISPEKAFEGINLAPKPLLPLSVFVLVMSLGLIAFYYHLDINPHSFWQKAVEISLEKQGRSFHELPASEQEAYQQQIDWYSQHNWQMAILPGVIYYLLLPFAVSFIFYIGTLLLIGNVKYAGILSVTSYSFLATGLIQMIVMLTVITIRPPELDAVINRNYLVTNLALLTSVHTPVLNALLSQFDIFTIWSLILAILGIKKISGHLSLMQSGAVVIIPWLIWVVVRIILAYLFRN